jgi:hypothetical protein
MSGYGNQTEIMNAGDKDYSWSVTKPSSKVHEKLLKTIIISLEASHSKFQLSIPETSVCSADPCIIIQANISSSSPFSIEFHLSDDSNSKKKILFTSSTKEISKSFQTLKVPNSHFSKGLWTNLKFDLEKWTTFGFDSTFKTFESINISGILKLSKIFSSNRDKNDFGSLEYLRKGISRVPFHFSSQYISPETCFQSNPGETRSKSTKRSIKRPPITTAPVEQIKRATFLTKNQGKTSTGFFMKTKNDVSPVKIQENLRDSRKGSSSSRRHSLGENIDSSLNVSAKEPQKPLLNLPVIRGSVKKSKKICINREKSPIKINALESFSEKNSVLPVIGENNGKNEISTQRFTDFLMYPNSVETMSNSIEEEIEVESCQVDEESHHFYPRVLQDSHKKPTFFLNEMAKATELRPFTPPFELYDKYSEIEESLPKLTLDPPLPSALPIPFKSTQSRP